MHQPPGLLQGAQEAGRGVIFFKDTQVGEWFVLTNQDGSDFVERERRYDLNSKMSNCYKPSKYCPKKRVEIDFNDVAQFFIKCFPNQNDLKKKKCISNTSSYYDFNRIKK